MSESPQPSKPQPVELLDPDAAEIVLGVSGKQVRNLCAAGHFGEKVGGTWVIQRPCLDWYAQYGRRKRGRPLMLAGEPHGPDVQD